MKKLMYPFFLGTLTCVLAWSNGAWAGSTFTPVSGEYAYAYADLGKQWTDDEGILHIRDAVLVFTTVSGDFQITGESYAVFNLNLDLETGNGDSNNFSHYEGTFGDLSGTWSGHSSGTYTAFVDTGKFVFNGDGDFAGMHLRGTYWIAFGSGIATWEGIIHDPQGDKSGAENRTWGDVKSLYH